MSTEPEPASTATTTESTRIGPDRKQTFIGYAPAPQRFVTPELESAIKTHSISYSDLTLQQYIAQSGLSPAQAIENWEQETKQLTTFETYNANKESPGNAEGTIVFFPGHDVHYGAATGQKKSGELIRTLNGENYDVVTPKYAEQYDPKVMKTQLLALVESIKGRNKPTIIGHSFGGFTILQAMHEMTEEELTKFLGSIDRIVLHNTPSGSNAVREEIRKAFKTNVGRQVYSKIAQPGIFAKGSTSSPRDTLSELVARGEGSQDKQGNTAAMLRYYNSPEAHNSRLKELFGTEDIMDEDFKTRLEKVSDKPEIVLTTSEHDTTVLPTSVGNLSNILGKSGFKTKLVYIEAEAGETDIDPDFAQVQDSYKMTTHNWNAHNSISSGRNIARLIRSLKSTTGQDAG